MRRRKGPPTTTTDEWMTAPLVHLSVDEQDDVYRARTRLQGCVRLLNNLCESDDYLERGPETIAAFDLLIEDLQDVSNTFDRIFDLALSAARQSEVLRATRAADVGAAADRLPSSGDKEAGTRVHA